LFFSQKTVERTWILFDLERRGVDQGRRVIGSSPGCVEEVRGNCVGNPASGARGGSWEVLNHD